MLAPADIDTFLQEVSRDRVAKHMRRDAPRECCVLAESSNESTNELRRSRFAAGVHEKVIADESPPGSDASVDLKEVADSVSGM